MSKSNVLDTAIVELSRVFRHVLPGFLILGAIDGSHPEWIIKFDLKNSIVLLFMISVVIGNIWYIIHRYTLHNFLDWIYYKRSTHNNYSYSDWVADQIYYYLLQSDHIKELFKHVHLRSAQIIFMFILSEVLIIFSLWNSEGTLFHKHWIQFIICGTILLGVAIYQFFVSSMLHMQLLEKIKASNQDAN